MKECTEEKKDVEIVLEENKKKITFVNKNRQIVRKVKVDGCAIKEGIRCDYLVISASNYEHFVELKGTDITHACEQLKASIKKLSKNPSKMKKHSFVIARKVVPAISTKIQIEKDRFKKHFNSKLIIINSPASFDLESGIASKN